MKILIYSLNYYPELTGIGKYSGGMAEWFSRKGHEVRVISGLPYYPEWAIDKSYSKFSYITENINGVQVYRSPLYVPKKPTIIKRLLHLLSFSVLSFPLVLRQFFWKPDVIIFIQPTLFVSFNAWVLSKLSKAKLVMHVQDYEVDAMLGLGMAGHSFITRLVQKLETLIMSACDAVSTISHTMISKAVEKGADVSQVLYFPNWTDVNYIHTDVDGAVLKKEWGFSKNDKVILYSGNIGKKQGLEIMLHAAKQLQVREEIHFLIVGGGSALSDLKGLSKQLKLNNVHFKPLQPWSHVPEMLSMAEIHLVLQKKGAADAVLPSKLTNILACGGYAIVTSELGTELGTIASDFPGIYNRIEPENLSELVSAINQELQRDLSKPNVVARDYAIQNISENEVLSRFERDLTSLIGRSE